MLGWIVSAGGGVHRSKEEFVLRENSKEWVESLTAPERIEVCSPILRALHTYASTHVHSVRGWLQAGPMSVIWALLDVQALAGVTGTLMEIGVFEGRTFGLLAAARLEDERLIAVDPFGSDQRRDTFIGNMKRLGVEDRILDIWAIPSAEFGATQDCRALEGKVRFLSLDGAHDYEKVLADLAISERVLGPEGIVAFDDFFNPWYPEVTDALFNFLNQKSKLVPFAIAVNFGPPSRGANKLFLCPENAVSRYRGYLERSLRGNLRKARVWRGVEVDVFDFEKGVYKFDPLLLIEPARA